MITRIIHTDKKLVVVVAFIKFLPQLRLSQSGLRRTRNMPAITYAYRGLMAPVFTQFNADGAVIHTAIDAYAAWLRSAGIGAVLVNGTSGEGPNLTVDERRSSAQHWANACRSHRLSLMVQCSGNLALPDVQRMAEHAQQIGADAVLLLPDLFWRPRSEEALMEYCGRVAKHCDRTPVLYYHYPAQTGVERE